MKSNQSQKNIPNGWQQVKLGDIGNSYSGIAGKNKEDFGFGKPFISYMNIYLNWKINPNINDFVNIKNGDNQNQVKYGDIFFTTSSETPDEVGIASVLLEKNIGEVYLNSFCFGFRLHNFKIIIPEYSRYFFRAKPFRVEMAIIAQGATRFNLSKKYFNKVLLNLPPLPEQNRIVAVLETWDKTIENLNKKIEIKKQIKKGLMQDLLTGKKRLRGFKEKWEIVRLGDVSDFINGFTFKSSTYINDGIYKIITISNVQDGFMLIDEPKTINELPSNINKEQILKKGDILISMTGNVGRVCVVNYDNCLLNQRVGKVISKNFNKDLLFLFLRDRKFLNQMIGSAQGGAQGNLSTGDITEYSFNAPKSKKEQKAIANILTTADKEITELEKKLEIIKEQKKYLLNNLITGTIRTPESLKMKS